MTEHEAPVESLGELLNQLGEQMAADPEHVITGHPAAMELLCDIADAHRAKTGTAGLKMADAWAAGYKAGDKGAPREAAIAPGLSHSELAEIRREAEGLQNEAGDLIYTARNLINGPEDGETSAAERVWTWRCEADSHINSLLRTVGNIQRVAYRPEPT